jgi:hypothetical protein
MNKKSLESAIEGALMAHKSAVWWQQEMSSALAALDRLENSTSFDIDSPEKREVLESKMEYLISKGQWEDNNLDQVMKRVELMTDEERQHIISEIHKRWALQKSRLGTGTGSN